MFSIVFTHLYISLFSPFIWHFYDLKMSLSRLVKKISATFPRLFHTSTSMLSGLTAFLFFIFFSTFFTLFKFLQLLSHFHLVALTSLFSYFPQLADYRNIPSISPSPPPLNLLLFHVHPQRQHHMGNWGHVSQCLTGSNF